MFRIMLFLALLLFVSGCTTNEQKVQSQFSPVVVTDPAESVYMGRVKFNTISIRLLVLKHCPDNIADTDANQAVQAARLAETKGLEIKDIGNYHIDKEGKTNSLVWGEKISDLEGLKRFISEQMKIGAKTGDTLVIYTLGHGSGNGSVMRLGQRAGIMKIIAEAAEENNQETFWWQLSCHAGAHLPAISTLTERQQELFSMTASSPGNELSYFCTQGELMEKVFVAMANQSEEIDPNVDGIITAGELKKFMIAKFGRKRGELLYAKSDDEPIFGLLGGLANQIPIIDRNNSQGEYPRDYIPFPRHSK